MTSIEWLEEQIIKFHKWKLNPIHDENCFDEIELDKAIKKAKEIMHKQEIIDAHHCGRAFENKYPDSLKTYNESAEQYYNQKFKNKK
jgi:hypothetical protein